MRFSPLRRYLLFAALFLAFPPCAGQMVVSVQMEQDSLFRHISERMSVELGCYFTHAQDSGAICSEQGNNAAELEKLDIFISQALSHPDLSISRICLTGYCSIEGDYARNEALAIERVEDFYAYLSERYPQLSYYPCDWEWVAEDWDGLSRLVEESLLQEREEVLEIIRSITEYDAREALLTKLNDGIPWAIMERELFPQLHRVEIRVEYQTKDYETTTQTPTYIAEAPEPEAEAQPSSNSVRDEASDSTSIVDVAARSPIAAPRFVLKTNLLLLAGIQFDFSYTAPTPNVALEYYITRRWSVELGAMYSNWKYLGFNEEFQGIYDFRLEPRFHVDLFSGRLDGYLGAYGRVGDFDSRTMTGGDDAAQPTVNYTGKYWDAGLSAGVTVRLGRRLGLEAGVRSGYVASHPNKYARSNSRKWFDSRWRYSKVGITDLNLSLIIFL
jgi:hypothetical protein